MKNTAILSFILLVLFNISYTFSQTKNSNIENTTEYFHQRNEAVGLVKNKKWQESITILENLIKDYENDPDLFYLLGLSYSNRAVSKSNYCTKENSLLRRNYFKRNSYRFCSVK